MRPTVRVSVTTRSRSRQETVLPEVKEEDDDHISSAEGSTLEEDSLEELAQQVELEEGGEEDHSTTGEEPEGVVVGERRMAEARGPLITPTKFRGGPGDDVEDYLSKFDRIARANGWDDNKKLVVIPCYLEGAALKWYENAEGRLGADITWERVKEGLKATFQSVAFDEQLEYHLRMRMQRDEPVETYVQDVIYLCSKVDAEMPERSRIKHVLRGLRPSLLEKVMVMTNDSLDTLLSNIRKIQTARFMAGQRVDQMLSTPLRGVGATSAGQETTHIGSVQGPSSLERKLEDLTSEFTKLSMRILEQQQTSRQTPPQPKTHRTPRREERREEEVAPPRMEPRHVEGRGRGRGFYRNLRGRTSDGRVICYRCNKVGHYAVACRTTDQGNEGERR